MANRIRPVHSSSLSRTRVPKAQFGQSFNLLRPETNDHGFVIIGEARAQTTNSPRGAENRNKMAIAARLITPIGLARTHLMIISNSGSGGASAEGVAPFSPGLVRRFPFSALLTTSAKVFFPTGLANGEIAKMMVKASGRPALIIATGLLFLCVNPMKAETNTETSASNSSSGTAGAAAAAAHRYVRHGLRHPTGYAHRKSHSKVAKTEPDKPTEPAPVAKIAADDSRTLPAIPASVANANAQMLLAGVQFSAAAAIPSGADVQPATSDTPAAAKADDGTFVVAADELNDVDRNLREGGQSSAAAANPLPTPPAQAATIAMTQEGSVWNQASLIGKIFIGFGALLTMASAARLFMA
jgi:hypothetical protein